MLDSPVSPAPSSPQKIVRRLKPLKRRKQEDVPTAIQDNRVVEPVPVPSASSVHDRDHAAAATPESNGSLSSRKVVKSEPDIVAGEKATTLPDSDSRPVPQPRPNSNEHSYRSSNGTAGAVGEHVANQSPSAVLVSSSNGRNSAAYDARSSFGQSGHSPGPAGSDVTGGPTHPKRLTPQSKVSVASRSSGQVSETASEVDFATSADISGVLSAPVGLVPSRSADVNGKPRHGSQNGVINTHQVDDVSLIAPQADVGASASQNGVEFATSSDVSGLLARSEVSLPEETAVRSDVVQIAPPVNNSGSGFANATNVSGSLAPPVLSPATGLPTRNGHANGRARHVQRGIEKPQSSIKPGVAANVDDVQLANVQAGQASNVSANDEDSNSDIDADAVPILDARLLNADSVGEASDLLDEMLRGTSSARSPEAVAVKPARSEDEFDLVQAPSLAPIEHSGGPVQTAKVNPDSHGDVIRIESPASGQSIAPRSRPLDLQSAAQQQTISAQPSLVQDDRSSVDATSTTRPVPGASGGSLSMPGSQMDVGGQAHFSQSAPQGQMSYPVAYPVPVPQYFPMPPGSGWSHAEVGQIGNNPVDTSSNAQLPKLPEPSTSVANSADSPLELASAPEIDGIEPTKENGDSQESSRVNAVETDASASQIQARQSDRLEALRRFQNVRDLSKAELAKQHEPIAGNVPRLIAKNIAKLESIDSGKTEDVIAQIGVLAKTCSPYALSTLVSFADSQQVKFREAAAEALGRIEQKSSAVTLLGMLQDKATSVVDASIRSLLQLGYPELVHPLVCLGRVDVRCRAVITDAISELSDESKDKLVEPLQNAIKTKGDASASAFALYLLSKIKGSSLLTAYMGLAKHRAPEIRSAAIDAMVQTGEKQSVRFLNAGMVDPDPRVRASAAAGLAKISSPKSESLLIKALSDEDSAVRRSAAKTLVSLEGKETAAAASKLLSSESDPEVIESLLEIVGKGGTDDALKTLKSFLNGDKVELRHRAITTLRRLKNPKSVKMLVPLLKDPNADTRRMVVETIGQLKAKSVLPTLHDMLASDPEDQVRAAVARSLGELKEKDSGPFLEDSLRDCRLVQCQAAIALGMLGHRQAVPALLAQLRDAAPEVRYHACNALGQIGDLADPDPIKKLLEDNDSMVRRGAEAALKKLGYKVGQAKLNRHFRKLSSSLMPGVVAGALPGGTRGLFAASLLIVLLVAGYAGRGMLGSLGPSGASLPRTRIAAVAISPDAKLGFAARSNKVAEVWDLKEGKLIERFQRPAGTLSAFFNSDGTTVVMVSGDKAVQYKPSDGYSEDLESASIDLGGNIKTTYPHADGDQVWMILEKAGYSLVAFNLNTLKPASSIKLSIPSLRSIAVQKDNSMAAVVDELGLLHLLGGENFKPLLPKPIDASTLLGEAVSSGEMTSVAFDSTGQNLAVACENLVFVLELPSGNLKATLFNGKAGIGDKLKMIRFVGSELVAVSARGVRYTADANFKNETASASHGGSVMDIFDVTADLSTAFYCLQEGKDLFQLDAKSGKILHELK